MMKKSLLALLIALLGLAANAYAEDKTVVVGVKDADKTILLPAPKAGENLNVIVEVPVPVKTALVPVMSKSNVSIRGGIGWSYFTDSEGIAWTGDLVGQIGFKSSPWRVRARLGFGEARYNTRALGGSLAAMYRLFSTDWSVGVGVDGLATINKNTHPRETVKEKFGGGSIRASFQHGNAVLEGFVGYGEHGTRAAGDTPEEWNLFGGVTLSYLWGK